MIAKLLKIGMLTCVGWMVFEAVRLAADLAELEYSTRRRDELVAAMAAAAREWQEQHPIVVEEFHPYRPPTFPGGGCIACGRPRDHAIHVVDVP